MTTAILAALTLSAKFTLLPAGPGPLSNPGKGFASYCQPNQHLNAPTQMAFEEIGWDQLEPEEGRFSFSDWENRLWNVAPAKGRHVVLRVYTDYPSQPSSVPRWLVSKGVKMTHYDEFGGGESPDYENPIFRKALLNFIRHFGARYDADPRVDYVQVGLLGHWGEWHTYPHENLFASEAVQREVLQALRAAFPHKPLMARNASYRSCQVPWVGFHDDMIPSDTFGSHSWEFLPALEKGGVSSNWMVVPTGGEMVPGAAHQYLGKDWPLLMAAVRKAHFSWIGPYCPAMTPDLTPTEKVRVEKLIRTLGYQFRLKSIRLPARARVGEKVRFLLDGDNEGVAPIYGNLRAVVALVDRNKRIAFQTSTSANPGQWLPGRFQVNATMKFSVPPGSYKVGFGLLRDGDSQPAVQFANRLETAGGFTEVGEITLVKPLTN